MLDRYLPKLLKITVTNFSLYPQKHELTHNFISGINLVIGGNGVGKTTFLNLVKFALIGLYKKDLDVKRREYSGVQKRYEGRVNLSYNYFKNRMNDSVDYNEEAKVKLLFEIKNVQYSITRKLNDGTVLEFALYENNQWRKINGNTYPQKIYDGLIKDTKKNAKTIQASLQGIYEDHIKKACGHDDFSYLIFLLNEVLFFNEERNTIMWDSDFQDKFSAYFLIDPVLWKQLNTSSLDAKYFDSLSRHKSEDMRALSKVLERLKDEPDFDKTISELHTAIEEQKSLVKKYFKTLKRTYREQVTNEKTIDRLYSKRNGFHKKISTQNAELSQLENTHLDNVFSKVTPKYAEYLKFIKSHKDCPLCNNSLDNNRFEQIIENDHDCMMCGSSIKSKSKELPGLTDLKEKVDRTRQAIVNADRQILELERDQEALNFNYQQAQEHHSKARTVLRKLKFNLESELNKTNNSMDDQFTVLANQMAELETAKDEAAVKSKAAQEVANGILEKIDSDKRSLTMELSEVFDNFASKFLGIKCELEYYDPGDGYGERYLPKIGGIIRESPEELSESQRFFIDQSFRMSLLAIFNRTDSFFLCETPDASLDISYERNAAQVYLEFVKNPNELILTTNLNNSDFLTYLITESRKGKITAINLLNYGNQSNVQLHSTQLKESSRAIEKLIKTK